MLFDPMDPIDIIGTCHRSYLGNLEGSLVSLVSLGYIMWLAAPRLN